MLSLAPSAPRLAPPRLALTRTALLTLFTLAQLGCSKAAEPAADKETSEAPTADPELVKLAAPAKICFSERDTETEIQGKIIPVLLRTNCRALVQWRDDEKVRAKKADPTLLLMLTDTDEATRWVAAVALSEPRALHRDLASAQALLGLAWIERGEQAGHQLGVAVGTLDLEATKLDDKVREIATKHPLPSLRAGLATRLAEKNPQLFDVVEQLARHDADPEVRNAAVDVLPLAPEPRRAQAGTLWIERAGIDKTSLGKIARTPCPWSAEICSTKWDDLLTRLEAETGPYRHYMVMAAEDLLAQPGANATHKRRVEQFLLKVSETEGDELSPSKTSTRMTLAKLNPNVAKAEEKSYSSDAARDRAIRAAVEKTPAR